MTRLTLTAFTALAALSASACGQAPEADEQGAAPGGDMEMTDTATRASATLLLADGSEVGTATFQDGAEGLLITIEGQLAEDQAGWHATHLHGVGDCSASDFTSAGGHIAPGGKEHGLLAPGGAHAGDLPNSYVHSDGTLRAQFHTTLISLDGQFGRPALLDEDGSALLLHASRDDLMAENLGGSGARLVCGVIEAGE